MDSLTPLQRFPPTLDDIPALIARVDQLTERVDALEELTGRVNDDLGKLEDLAMGVVEGHPELSDTAYFEDDTEADYEEDELERRLRRQQDEWMAAFIVAVRGYITSDMAEGGENAAMKDTMRERVMRMLAARQAGRWEER